jgi:hypothetical protein
MGPCLCILFAAVVAAGQAPSPDFERLERRMQDLIEQERFEELAREGETAFARAELLPWQRRALAFYAVRGLQGVAEASGQVAVLCRARSLLQRVEREVGLDDDAATAARLRDQTEQKLRDPGLRDPCAVARPRSVAATPMPRPAQLMPVRVDPPAPTANAADDAPSVLVDIPRRSAAHAVRPSRPTLSTPPAPESLPPAPEPVAPEPTRPRGRTIGGSLLLVAGAGLAAGMTAALVLRSEENAAIMAIDKQIKAEQRDETSEDVATVLRHDRAYRQLTAVAGVTGTAAVLATIAGVTLLAIPPQGRRTTATLSATPWSATLMVAGHF